MKFLIVFALLAASALAGKKDKKGSGEMNMMDMMSEEDMFLMHLMPIMHGLKMKMMEEMKDMEPRPKLECMVKGHFCAGMDSEFAMKAMAAKEECHMDAMDEQQMEGNGEEEDCKEKWEMLLEHFEDQMGSKSDEMSLHDVLMKIHHIKMFMKFKMHMHGMKCFLGKMGWYNEETHELNREAIAADLGTTKIAADVAEADGMCYEKSMEITEDCLEKLAMMGMGEDMGDMEEPAMSRGKKDKKDKKKDKKNKSGSEEDIMDMEMCEEMKAALLDATRNLVYVGCVMHTVDEVCRNTITEALGMEMDM